MPNNPRSVLAPIHVGQLVRGLAFAVSAQEVPASLMVFSLCSSARVHGTFARLFFAGCSMREAILGSSSSARTPQELDGAAMGGGFGLDYGSASPCSALLLTMKLDVPWKKVGILKILSLRACAALRVLIVVKCGYLGTIILATL